ncbi:eukaryotic translation initiation factor 3 subunit 6 [Sistotremastrum niveocremeum HHB9708]|uniref:Eukaryotic translation initiation factor 3 subunit L n=1 Tax=Sistotremastrum niveocremeum HHB9708 TaxID=1314777 RepID=A0A164N4M5_9AGAM|nr:eukaryotic translation initiation factor 3 subunit 6 [Sistotremastrum niveocremeum HHB9708]
MSHRMPLWNAETDADDELVEVDVNLALGNYGQNGLYDDAQPRIDETTLVAAQQIMAHQAAFAQIPDGVKRFIVHFYQAITENNLPEITSAYESGWNRMTEKFYAKTEWPEAEVIAPLVNDDPIFLILYRELYYRHVYSRLSPNIDDRFHSYENSCELFNYLLNSEGPVTLELPDQWLWDIIDEFIYQFQSFCLWRSKVHQKSDEEISMLATEEGASQWSCYSVLNVLYSFIQKSKINEYLVAQKKGLSQEDINDIVGEYGSKQLYRMLGYFSVVGLLRVHVLLGDYTLALKVMENVELNQKTSFTRVTACHVATYYYVGFCYMTLKRYTDASRTFVSILNLLFRIKNYHSRSYQYDQINKTADRMYALFAICYALSPGRHDDQILNMVKERYGEQLSRMSRGEEGLQAFEELFLYACPKFITANPPPYRSLPLLAQFVNSPPPEPAQRHVQLFLSDVRNQLSVPTLRSFLKLYTSLDARKLAGFLDEEEEGMVEKMMVLKQASRSISRAGLGGTNAHQGRGAQVPAGESEGGLLDGQTISTSDLDFVINQNMVHISESTVGRRYAGWFIRNTEYAQRVYDGVKNSPLPLPRSTTAPAAPGAKDVAPAPAPEAPVKKGVAWGANVKAA